MLRAMHDRKGSFVVGSEADLREVARHDDALLEVAQPRLRALAARECERELRVAAARSKRDRKASAETRVHVRDRKRAVGLAEALHVGRAFDSDDLRNPRAVLDQLAVLD